MSRNGSPREGMCLPGSLCTSPAACLFPLWLREITREGHQSQIRDNRTKDTCREHCKQLLEHQVRLRGQVMSKTHSDSFMLKQVSLAEPVPNSLSISVPLLTPGLPLQHPLPSFPQREKELIHLRGQVWVSNWGTVNNGQAYWALKSRPSYEHLPCMLFTFRQPPLGTGCVISP